MCHLRKDKRKRVKLMKFGRVWKAFDKDDYVVARALTKADCIKICIKRGCVVK